LIDVGGAVRVLRVAAVRVSAWALSHGLGIDIPPHGAAVAGCVAVTVGRVVTCGPNWAAGLPILAAADVRVGFVDYAAGGCVAVQR
jgi:hypothetical protein